MPKTDKSQRGLGSLLIGGRFSLNEVLEPAACKQTDADEHLKTVFEWYQARSSAAVRGALASAATVIVAFIVAALDDKAEIKAGYVIAGTFGVTLLGLAALWMTWHLGHIQKEYLVSVRLVHELGEFQPALAAHVTATGGADVT